MQGIAICEANAESAVGQVLGEVAGDMAELPIVLSEERERLVDSQELLQLIL